MLQLLFVLHKLRFLYIGILATIASLLLLWLAIAAVGPAALQTGSADTSASLADMYMSDSPNAVTNALSIAAYNAEQTLDSAARASSNAVRSAALTISQTGSHVVHHVQRGAITALRGIGSGIAYTATTNGRSIAFVAKTVGRSISFVFRIPGTIFGLIANNSAVNAVIKPADHNPVPIIDPRAPAVLAAKEALPATPPANPAMPPTSPEAIWPMHGQVTTEFGVSGWPYKTVHAGIDISDGQPSGVTPVKAFRRGKVIAAERSGGLGNHVIVDHGSDVTSVYGHLASISVQVGQEVDTSTVVGRQGTTGVSTGPHLHFEIRVHGQATDPRQFISGTP